MRFGRDVRRDRVLAIDMTPMIDIVFQLLIFFLVTARMAQMSRADIDLPRERGEQERSKEQAGMTVNVAANGEIRVAERVVTLDELEALAADLASSPSAQGGGAASFRPLVRADTKAPTQRLNAVLGAPERAGVKAIRLATSPPEH